MAQSNDKPRASVREASRLRATLSSEPSGGYAFHDERRVAQQRPAPSRREGASTNGTEHHSWTERPFDLGARLKGSTANDADDVLFGDAALPDPPSEVRAASSAGDARDLRAESLAPPADAVPTEGIWTALPSVMDDVGDGPVPTGEASPHLTADPLGPSDRDPLILQAEQLVERGAWDELVQRLGDETELSPALELLLLIGRREIETGDDREQASALSSAIISAVARTLSLPEDSPAALIIGKRLMRRNPVWTRKQPAGGLSVGIVLLGLGLGTAIGWLITKLTL